MLKSYRVGWGGGGGGGPCDFSVSPSPFGPDFGLRDFGLRLDNNEDERRGSYGRILYFLNPLIIIFLMIPADKGFNRVHH